MFTLSRSTDALALLRNPEFRARKHHGQKIALIDNGGLFSFLVYGIFIDILNTLVNRSSKLSLLQHKIRIQTSVNCYREKKTSEPQNFRTDSIQLFLFAFHFSFLSSTHFAAFIPIGKATQPTGKQSTKEHKVALNSKGFVAFGAKSCYT